MNYLTCWLLGLCCIGYHFSAQAQTRLSGTVSDPETKEALISVIVTLGANKPNTLTDVEGKYELLLEKGEHVLTFQYLGYETRQEKVEADGVNPITLDVQLASGITGDVIIVTDGKYEKKLEESTVSVDVISPKMLQNNIITSLDDAVKKVSGVQMMDGQVNIRGGAGFAYGAGSRVAFLVDGQQLLSAELSDVKWNFVPIENAEQIEVIKGSASVLYGSGALNGVINVRTAYPSTEPYTAFTMYAGVYDQPKVDSMRWYNPKDNLAAQPMFWGGFFAHRQRLTPKFDLVLGGNYHLSNGFIKEFDERRFRFNANTKYRPREDGKIAFGLNTNLMYHEVETFFIAQDMGKNAFRSITESNSRDRYVTLTLDPYFTAYDKFDNKHDVKGRWFMINKPRGGNPSVANLFSLEYQFQRTFANKIVLTAGSMSQHFRANSVLFDDNSQNSTGVALFGGYSSALYAQVDKKFFNRLSATLGFRWEHFWIDTIYAMAPPVFRAGLNYQASENDFIRASFGQGFRFPSLAERYINEPLPAGGIQIGIFPNPDILPESGWSSELAYRRTFKIKNYRIYADAALFWMQYKNMVEFMFNFYEEGLGFKTVNIAEARIAGWEISTQGEGLIGKTPLRIWGGYTYSCPANMSMDTTLQNVGNYLKFMTQTFAKGIAYDDYASIDKLLRYRSLHNFRLDVETEFMKKFVVGAVANFNSYVHGVDAAFTLGVIPNFNEFRAAHPNGDWIFDARFAYKITDKQRISFVINNIGNRVYSFRPARVEAPRTFSVKYNHQF